MPQQDEYKTSTGKLISDSEFWKGTEKALDVQDFKRFAVDINVATPKGSGNAQILLSVRGNIVTITRPKGVQVAVRELLNALMEVAKRFDYQYAGHSYYPNVERGLPKGVVPVEAGGNEDLLFATVGDPYWFADVLHHVRTAGGFDQSGRVGPPA